MHLIAINKESLILSNKLIAGIFAGTLAGITIAVLLNAKTDNHSKEKDERIFTGTIAGIYITFLLNAKKDNDIKEEEDSLTENDTLDKANEFLLQTRRKAEKMIADAELKSNSILEEAGKILFHAKEKTSALHYGHNDTALEDISRIKKEKENIIEDFKRKLESDL